MAWTLPSSAGSALNKNKNKNCDASHTPKTDMSNDKPFNPFYSILVVAGAAFGVTAMAFASASVIAQQNPHLALESQESGRGLIALMDVYGFPLMLIEIAVLAVASVLAMTTDGYWTRRAESANAADVQTQDPTSDQGSEK
jgi:hypothetical protein